MNDGLSDGIVSAITEFKTGADDPSVLHVCYCSTLERKSKSPPFQARNNTSRNSQFKNTRSKNTSHHERRLLRCARNDNFLWKIEVCLEIDILNLKFLFFLFHLIDPLSLERPLGFQLLDTLLDFRLGNEDIGSASGGRI